MTRIYAFVGILFFSTSYWCVARADVPAKFNILLGGDAFFEAAYVRQNTDTDANRTENFMSRWRLTMTPTAVTDDGLTYGARLRLRATAGTGMIDGDQAFIFARGGFGRIELGTQYNPELLYNVIAPTNFGTGGLDGDWSIGDVGWIQNQFTFLEAYSGGGYTVTTFVKEANRINYISPRWFSDGSDNNGLMATASYAPVNRAVFTGVQRLDVNSNAATSHPFGYGRTKAFSNCMGGGLPLGCNYQDIYELGLRYDHTVQGMAVSLGAAHLGGSTKEVNFGTPQSFYDLSAWQAGLQLGVDGFLIGGSYANAGRSAYPRQSLATGPLYQDDQYTWTAGISYERGPVSVGFNYQHGHDAGDLTVPGARTAGLYATGVTWHAAKGLSLALEALRSTTHNESGFVRDPLGATRMASGNATMVLCKTLVTF